MKTYSAKPADIKRQWYLLDGSMMPLGRLATTAAKLLLGKEKPGFTPHVDCGDYVIIINSDSLLVTGNKRGDKVYYRHSGYPGALRSRTLDQQLSRDSTRVVTHAVRGMLPSNKLRPGRLMRLKVYGGDQHQHTAQSPIEYVVKKDKE
jgi:large subunit ribosomal protein L13